MVCKLCGQEIPEEYLEESLEKHLQETHFLSYPDYYEILMTGGFIENCWKCGSPRYSLSPWIPHFLPCECCVNKQNREEIKEGLLSEVKKYLQAVSRSKYYQYVLSLDPSERHRFLGKNIKEASELLQHLKKTDKTRLDKTHIIQVSSFPGTTEEISERNLKNLTLEAIEFKVGQEEDGRFSLGETGLYLKLPEVVNYDPRHHSRASILNPGAKRSAKRLRMGASDCIKFYPTPNPTVRSILALEDIDGKNVSLLDLPHETAWKVKFGILKTKEIISRVFDVYTEILKYLSYLEDPVFLLNSVPLLGGQDLGMTLTWSWEEQDWTEKIIKLSIL